MIKLVEKLNYPYEGYFWIINDNIVGITSEVPQYNYDYSLDGKTHQNTWNSISNSYKVDGKTVEWNYFPRGRVMTDPNYDADGKFTDYTVIVFLDECIDNNSCKELIANYYNLNLPTVSHITWQVLNRRAGIDHYNCHNCRDKHN